MKLLRLFSCIIILGSCEGHSYIKKQIKVNTGNGEQCFYFSTTNLDTLKFNRHIQILKNTLNDTILFGYGILAPGQVGNVGYTRLGNRNDAALNLNYKNPKTDRICISPYKKKEVKGILLIKLDTL